MERKSASNQSERIVFCVDQGGGKSSVNIAEELSPTLATSHGGEPVIAFSQNQRDEVRALGEASAAVCANTGMKQQTYVMQGSIIGRKDENGPQGNGVNEDVSFTLNTVDRHAVYTMTTGSFTDIQLDKTPTLMARDYKDPTLVAKAIDELSQGDTDYTVRRLTPTECARLQGFPDWWCSDLATEHPTDAEVYEWYKIFETHRRVVGGSSKPKTDKQIRAFLKDPHSDAAEYKMWGNGIALPNAYFVLSGIAWASENVV